VTLGNSFSAGGGGLGKAGGGIGSICLREGMGNAEEEIGEGSKRKIRKRGGDSQVKEQQKNVAIGLAVDADQPKRVKRSEPGGKKKETRGKVGGTKEQCG